MAQVTITKIFDGPKSAVMHVSLLGDGSGDLTDAILIDPAQSFDPALKAKPLLTVEQLWYDFSGFSARLEFDDLVSDTPVWTMSGSQAAHVDFCDFGGLKDRSGELDGLGKLKLTTSGFIGGSFGTLIIKVRKT